MPNRDAPCLEDEMQKQVAEYFSQRRFVPSSWNGFHNSMIIPKVYREVKIPHIGRISDIIIYITDRKIVNIECKLSDYGGVISQAIDHLRWADYSYVCFFADTYLPAYEIDRLLTNGIGLLLWNKNIFVEVIQSGFNKSKDKVLRSKVLDILKKKESVKTGEIELSKQGVLDY